MCRLFIAEILFILSITGQTNGIAIPNGVVGTPLVQCQQDSISISFQTQAPFDGRVYIKGFADSNQCPKVLGDSRSTNPQITLQFNEACGVRRIRTSQGINHNAVVIISFHPSFLTKVDKAYAIQCEYQEGTRTVSQGITVPDLTTSILTDSMSMPLCRYDVLNNDQRYGPIGAQITSAVVGQQVIHRWSCEEEMPDSFCMRVFNCYVDDGRQDQQTPIIDQQGCTTDQYAIPTPTYNGNVALTAESEAHVFKFADRPVVYFQCSIELSRKTRQSCPRPVCTGTPVQPTRFPGFTRFPGGGFVTSRPFTRFPGGGGFLTSRPFTRFPGGGFITSRPLPTRFPGGGGFRTRFPDSNFSGFRTRFRNLATRFPSGNFGRNLNRNFSGGFFGRPGNKQRTRRENQSSNLVQEEGPGNQDVQHRLTVLDIDPDQDSWNKQDSIKLRDALGGGNATYKVREIDQKKDSKGLCLTPISLATLIFLSVTLIIGTVSTLALMFRQEKRNKKLPRYNFQ